MAARLTGLLMLTQTWHKPSHRRVFRGKRGVRLEDFHRAFHWLGIRLQPADAAALFQAYDVNGDGIVDIQE